VTGKDWLTVTEYICVTNDNIYVPFVVMSSQHRPFPIHDLLPDV
jgi:hypothetical protein